MITATESILEFGGPQPGIMMLSECLRHLSLNVGNRALCHHNLAMYYRIAKKPRLIVKHLKMELEILQREGDRPGDEAEAHGYLAESYRSQGDIERYTQHWNAAEQLVQSDLLSVRRRAFHYLALADCAYIHEDREWERHLLEIGLAFCAHYPELRDDYFPYVDQCLQENLRGQLRGPESGIMRYPHPRDIEAKQVSRSVGELAFYEDNS